MEGFYVKNLGIMNQILNFFFEAKSIFSSTNETKPLEPFNSSYFITKYFLTKDLITKQICNGCQKRG